MKEEKISATENTQAERQFQTRVTLDLSKPLVSVLFLVYSLSLPHWSHITSFRFFSSLAKANNKLTLKESLRARHAEGHIVDMKCLYSEANKILTLTK